MLKHTLLSLALVLAVAASPVWAADPTADQIYQTLEAGNLQQAQQMIDQVLKDHPHSVKAHYIAAEVAAKRGNFGIARQELATARQINPALPGISQYSINELDRQLAQGTPGAVVRHVQSYQVPVYPVQRHSSFPWGWVLLFGGILVFWLIMRNRAAAYRSYPGPVPGPMGGMPGPMGGPMMGGGYGGYGPPGGGSGILGGLASGLAIGAGVAAGEELVNRVFDGNQQSGGFIPNAGANEVVDYPDSFNSDSGGADFGVSDPAGSWDDGSSGGGGGDDWT